MVSLCPFAQLVVTLTREDGDHVTVLRPVVTLHDKLMRSGNQRQAIVVIKGLRNVLSKGVTGATRRDSPAASVIGIRPQKIAHGTLVGDFLDTVQGSDVVQSVNAGRQTSVEAENLVVDQGSQRQVVEEIGKVLPYVGVAVLSKAFIVETIDLGNLSGLVVASENGDALGVSDFEGDKESNSLD